MRLCVALLVVFKILFLLSVGLNPIYVTPLVQKINKRTVNGASKLQQIVTSVRIFSLLDDISPMTFH